MNKEDYPIFRFWYQTLDTILSAIERFPRHARFSVASRLADAALDTLTLIVEAMYTRNRLRLLDRINLLLEQQRVLFRVACDRRYLSIKQHAHIAAALDETGRMVGGWRKTSRAKSRASV
jgi:hypothetical protein